MSQKSKQELLEVVRPRYLKATKLEKQNILTELVAATGYHRKYALRVLHHPRSPCLKRKRTSYKRVYRGDVVSALEHIWEIYGQLCSKRLQPFLPEAIQVLERWHEIDLPPDTKTHLLKISSASIDRCLRPMRIKAPHSLSTTKPGTLLKQAIAIQTFTPWDDERPGFMEIDLVAHCGDSAAGQFLVTLTCTDICTGWTELSGLLHRSQEAVCDAIQVMRCRLPFPLRGLDSDNGAEFINDLLYRYCVQEHLTFTRSRPYKKNDQAHVEQKNWSVVRHIVGYDRWETEAELKLLKSIYDDLRLYVNFFQPSFKLIGKERLGTHLRKRYDVPKTPYQRILDRTDISAETKARLTTLYQQLNPAELRRQLDLKVANLWKISR